MAESLTVLALLVLTILAWIIAQRRARNSANRSPRLELERLQHQAMWLEERLDTARRERWARDMIASISDDLAATTQRIAEMSTQGEKAAAAAVS